MSSLSIRIEGYLAEPKCKTDSEHGQVMHDVNIPQALSIGRPLLPGRCMQGARNTYGASASLSVLQNSKQSE